MTDHNSAVDAAIAAEEAALLRSFEEEPPYLSQLVGLFSGRTGWVSMMMMVAQLVLFGTGVWCAIGFFDAADTLVALKWGIPAAVLIIMSLMVKLALWPVIHINRMIAQIQRLDLSILRMTNQL